MNRENICTVIPNHNNNLFIAMLDENDDIDLLSIVAFYCESLHIPGDDVSYTSMSPLSFYEQHSSDEDYFIYDKLLNRWWSTPGGECGKGIDTLKNAILDLRKKMSQI